MSLSSIEFTQIVVKVNSKIAVTVVKILNPLSANHNCSRRRIGVFGCVCVCVCVCVRACVC